MINLLTLIDELGANQISKEQAREAIAAANLEEFASFLGLLSGRGGSISPQIWPTILAGIGQRDVGQDSGPGEIESLKSLYLELGQNTDRYHLLTRLARIGTHESLRDFVDLMLIDPPTGALQAAAPFLPLFHRSGSIDPQHLFPQILDGLANPDIAAAILDVANYMVRKGQVDVHPGAARFDHLLRLSEAVGAYLEMLQTHPATSPEQLRERQTQVASSLPLAVSLCDALGLIGDDRAIPTLSRLSQLKHRRLRVEAAAALVRLSETTKSPNSEATELLLELAAEPIVRLRVLAYAEELGLLDEVAAEYASPLAVAEAELTVYLALPTQMGIPPATCELIDSRTLYWPGFEEPRNCYLFRYGYQVASESEHSSAYHSIGIAGPLVHAFHADLADQPIENIYAAFAGWHAEHEDIREMDATRDSRVLRTPVIRHLLQRLEQSEYGNLQPHIVASFFEYWVLVAGATRQGSEGTVVIDQDESIEWYPSTGRSRPIGPAEAYCIYKGRRLLRSFNVDGFDE